MADAFCHAIRDSHRGTREEPLFQRDGETVREHPIEDYYFEPVDPEAEYTSWLESWLDGPMVDLGAGAGRDALYFQEQFEVVAIEPSEALVETMGERGVHDAREGDMFSLREHFEPDRFQSALAFGTQMCLAGSMQGLRRFLADLAHVTTPDATAILHSYDPDADGVEDLLGYRNDPAPGLAHRLMWFEYGDDVDEALYFRLFGPDRLREAADATGWAVADVVRPNDPVEYRAAIKKR
jgi:hypothetical protein